MNIEPNLQARLQRLIDEDVSAARAETGLGCFVYLLPLGALVTIAVGSWWVLGTRNHTEQLEMGTLFGGATAVILLSWLAARWKWRQARSPLHDAVMTRREEVVWVYPRHTNVRLTDFYSRRQVGEESRFSIMVAFQDGTAVVVALRSVEALAELSRVLEGWLPRATHGYSSELDSQFVANPASLRRAE